MSLLQDCINLTTQLINIPSESSEHTSSNSDFPENNMVEFLKKLCIQHQIPFEVQEVFPGRFNLIANFFSTKINAKKILITAHMDTVSATGMENPFSGAFLNDRIWGRGSCDDKGPMAVALATLLYLHQKELLSSNVVFAATVDEECSLSGAAKLVKKIDNWDLCIGLEPTNLRIVNAHKGVYRCKIITEGIAAHSSTPHKGRNAIIDMQPIINDLQILAFRIKRHKDPDLGRASLAITTIQGGSSENIIPDKCTITLDIRLLPHQTPKDVTDAIKSTVQGRAKIEGIFSAKGIKSSMENEHIKKFQDVLKSTGHESTPTSVSYATDCSKLIDNGPCIVWGPGNIQHAHQLDEHIEIKQLENACSILSKFLST